MYNETYDNYIRSILGYPTRNQFEQYNYEPQEYQEYRNPTFNTNINISGNNVELENSYPEIYKIVYPMVTKKCDNMRGETITRDDIENMTDEIYSAIEVNSEINLNINLQNKTTGNRQENKVSTSNILKSEDKNEKRGEDRQFGNRNLRDLIQILIIRELLRRPRPERPPFPGPGGRPPFPGGPGRPPFRPREYDDMDIYERY